MALVHHLVLLMFNSIFKNTIPLRIVLCLLFFLFAFSPTFLQAQVTRDVSVTATVAGEVITTSPGGGSSGSVILPKTAVNFSGLAYPRAAVSLLKFGVLQTSVIADENGAFNITLEELYDNTILYSLVAEDVSKNRSLLINYPIVVKVGLFTQLSNIRFAPTIVTDKSAVRTGDYLTVSGYALKEKQLEVIVSGAETKIFILLSSVSGAYKIILPTSGLPKGEYSLHIRYKDDERSSKLIKFTIGDANVFYAEQLSSIPGDCNADKVINLVDFSILAFWYGKSNPPKCVDTNNDNKINLVDFSILAFYWTG